MRGRFLQRLVVIASAVTFSGAILLAGPSTVWAAYSHSVSFPGDVECGSGEQLQIGGTAAASSTFSGSAANIIDGNTGTAHSTTNPINGRYHEINLSGIHDVCMFRVWFTPAGGSGTASGFTITEDTNCFSVAGGLVVPPSRQVVNSGSYARGEIHTVEVEVEWNAFQCMRITWAGTATGGMTVYEIEVYGGEEEAHPCNGVGSLAMDELWIDKLATINDNIWGDTYHEVANACYHQRGTAYRYTNATDPGNTFRFTVEAFRDGGAYDGERWVRFNWVTCDDGGEGEYSGALRAIHLAFDERWPAHPVKTGMADAPGAVCAIDIIVTEGVGLIELRIEDIDGTGDDPGYLGSDGGEDSALYSEWWLACDPPEDAIDVPGWLAYGACIVIEGFKAVVRWLVALPGRIADAVAGFVGGVPIFLGDAFAGIGAIIGDVLDFLFIPDTVGDSWADFLALASTRVPFVYVAEVADAVGGIDGSMAGSAAVFSFTVMDAPVSFNAGGISDDLAIIRTPLAGLVWLGLAWTVFHRVGGSLGIARSESSVQSG